jgi:hypothetical protein
VTVRADTGGCQWRLNTVPAAIAAAPPSPAAMPIGSSAASGDRTISATPRMPTSAAATAAAFTGVPITMRASSSTISGWMAPTVAATPPGRR